MNDNEFGKFLCKKRLEADISIHGAAAAIGISPQFLNDIEKGRCLFPPVPERMEIIRELYQLTDTEYKEFLDLVGKHRGQVAPDLTEYIMNNPEISNALRVAKETGVTSEEWKAFSEMMQKAHEPLLTKYDSEISIQRHSVERCCDWQVFKNEPSKKFLFYHISCDSELSRRALRRYGFEAEAMRVPQTAFKETFHLAYLRTGTEKLFLDTGHYYKEIPVVPEDVSRIQELKSDYAYSLGFSAKNIDKILLKGLERQAER